MATLENSTIASTYDQLLALPSNGGNGANLVALTDGNADTTFCLQLATTKAMIAGSGSKLFFSDEGGEYIYGDGTDLRVYSGADILLIPTSNVGIGTTSPDHKLEIEGEDANVDMAITCYSATTGHLPVLNLKKSAGSTPGTPASTANGTDLGQISFYGVNTAGTNAFVESARIMCEVVGSPDPDSCPASISFHTMDNVSLKERMRIDRGGGVGIGTADTPVSHLEIQAGTTTNGAILTLGTKETSVVVDDVLGRINFYAPLEGSEGDALLVGASVVAIAQDTFASDNNSTALHFQTGKGEVATTKMVIDEDGNVGIGTTNPNSALEISLASDTSAFAIGYGIDDTEQIAWQLKGRKTGGSNYRYAQLGIMFNTAFTETCGFVRMDQADGGVLYMWSQNDNDIQVSATATDVGGTGGTAVGDQPSDERLKNISSDAFPYGLNAVNQLKPIKYAYKKTPSVNHLGFGAQTTQSIIPECVYSTGNCPDGYTQDLYTADDDEVKNEEKEVGDEKGTQTPKSSEKDKLAMKYVEIVPVLVKAVQELSAKVTALENA